MKGEGEGVNVYRRMQRMLNVVDLNVLLKAPVDMSTSRARVTVADSVDDQ